MKKTNRRTGVLVAGFSGLLHCSRTGQVHSPLQLPVAIPAISDEISASHPEPIAWSRTLSMARALCELQFELQSHSSPVSVAATGGSVPDARITMSKCRKSENEYLIPKTPVGKETKTKLKLPQVSTTFTKSGEAEAELEADAYSRRVSVQSRVKKLEQQDLLYREGREAHAYDMVGNFPTPTELADLDESFLRKRCNLGYRASRILKLAKGIVEGRIHLTQIEEIYEGASFSSYNESADQLRQIDGFGPFTCANVLMRMGFYHVIPTDSETMRHLRQVHARESTLQTVQRDIESIYGKYAPYQFLAYWSELWHLYEKRFGKLSEMPCSNFKLITASKMRSTRGANKRKKACD
ncbi:hypothetical protein CJ030_MR8G006586 [Morella rubra]|uniref:HhH-GPD domain-containing protein n=1 Tax=Morella rubra TaxID=262757 RepID=A0A6A1UP52_9ROSI|nr:hypothetical protein CJ030_MR8G006586 [Morella rubra]